MDNTKSKLKNNLHSFGMGLCFSILAFGVVNLFILKINVWQWILLELIMGISEGFCKFVKRNLGLIDDTDKAESQ